MTIKTFDLSIKNDSAVNILQWHLQELKFTINAIIVSLFKLRHHK